MTTCVVTLHGGPFDGHTRDIAEADYIAGETWIRIPGVSVLIRRGLRSSRMGASARYRREKHGPLGHLFWVPSLTRHLPVDSVPPVLKVQP